MGEEVTTVKKLTDLCNGLEAKIVSFKAMVAEKDKQIAEFGKATDALQTKLEALAAKMDEETALALTLKERLDGIETAGKRLGEGAAKVAGPFTQGLGEQLQCVAKAMQTSTVDPRLLEVKALTEGANADGGFLVQTDFSAQLVERLHTTGEVYGRTSRVTISTGANGIKIPYVNEVSRKDGLRQGGVQGFWADEAGDKTLSQPRFGMAQLDLKKCIAAVKVSDELLQDAVALEGYIMSRVPQELMFKAENSFIRGLGAFDPLGILASGATVTVSKEVGQLAKTITAQNVIDMYAQLDPRSVANAVFYINQDCIKQLLTMTFPTGAAGTPVYLPPGGISGKPFGSILGIPVIPIEYCSTLGALGDIILADMSQYQVAEKGGIQSASSIHVEFLNDLITFRFVLRIDGQPLWVAPLVPFQGVVPTLPWLILEAR